MNKTIKIEKHNYNKRFVVAAEVATVLSIVTVLHIINLKKVDSNSKETSMMIKFFDYKEAQL